MFVVQLSRLRHCGSVADGLRKHGVCILGLDLGLTRKQSDYVSMTWVIIVVNERTNDDATSYRSLSHNSYIELCFILVGEAFQLKISS